MNPEALPEATDPELELRYVDIGSVGRGAMLGQPEEMTFAGAPSRARRIVRRGDVIISTVRTYLRAVLPIGEREDGLVVSTGFAVVRPKKLDPGYAAWLIQSDCLVEQVVARSVGVSYPAINPSELGTVKVPVPSRPEQRAIAEFLDRETARIDVLIAAMGRLLELAEAAFRSRQVARLIGLDHPDRKYVLQLGDLPTHWDARRAKFCTGGVTVGVVVNPSSYFVDNGIPFIHGTDVREGYVDMSALKYLSSESNSALAKSQVRQRDVVAMRVGYPGRAAVVPPELDGANCASILIFRRSDVLVPEMVAEFLNSTLGRAQIESVQYGAAQEVMNVSDAVNLVLPVPPIQEQARIAQELTRARQSYESAQSLINVQLGLLRERRIALINAAVIGELEIPGAPD